MLIRLIQVAYAQEWDMTATLATDLDCQDQRERVQFDLVRKVFETVHQRYAYS